MTARRALMIAWLVFALIVAAAVFGPALAQIAPQDWQFSFSLDTSTGMATLRYQDLAQLIDANHQLAQKLHDLQGKTGCL